MIQARTVAVERLVAVQLLAVAVGTAASIPVPTTMLKLPSTSPDAHLATRVQLVVPETADTAGGLTFFEAGVLWREIRVR